MAQSRPNRQLRGRLEILRGICSIPTAPFVEHRVAAAVEAFVKARPKLRLTRDRFGNLLIELPSGNRTVLKVQLGPDKRPRGALLRIASPVAPGTPGMWDQGAGRFHGRRFRSRVCDDLAGAAAALAMLDEILRRPPKVSVGVLLTRAEEEGFIGAIAASLEPALIRKTDRLIAIETSAAQPFAPQGKGAIIRVGDRTSVFNSALTYFINQVASGLARKDKSFRSSSQSEN